ncbi:MAG: TRAP transporter permease DctQ [Betaproteobacteria bacterium HGW-Betaproteobacteria-13]|jgi:TRAP-type C4-dicarboxylate transport system permease small subunit|uniref:TRAP transporter small permease protein n=1 Tax=Parazoarcus communis TaxID=41977 RepID=A0A2U8GZK5_9RHOO|nr:TRAP transporter small permease subunit [Parazoarcus communis]AWI78908.1 TRAP transporter permease DctQ [Parazoarcus communis]PKO79970.1 MAG: TRAP transporter permease DctQ [Betaproteobacteria bacterium HGW-Betaproteobacteria-13]
MRALLDSLYRLSGALAAIGMVATLVMVSAGIFSRPLGIYLSGTDDYAGYCMAACGFLALAYTFKHGEHIRVSLVIERVGPRLRKVLEWFSLAAATTIAMTLAWYAVRLAWQSHEFEDVSQGIDATPLWIPQLSMAIGTVVLVIALLDDLILTTLGHAPRRLASAGNEAVRME